MIACIHKKGTLQIIEKNKQQSPNLRTPVESYKNVFGTYICLVIINYKIKKQYMQYREFTVPLIQ